MSSISIYVGNDALAFFDADSRTATPISIDTITKYPVKSFWGEEYNFRVERDQMHNFSTKSFVGNLRTVCVTGYCIVFGAYTSDMHGKVKTSGVYHASSFPWEIPFKTNLSKLVDGVRSETNEKVLIKAAGNSELWENRISKVLGIINDTLDTKSIDIADRRIVLEPRPLGYLVRVTEFKPLEGQLVTYFDKDEKVKYSF